MLPIRHCKETVMLAVYHNLGNVDKPYPSNKSVIPVFTKGMYEYCCGHAVKKCESTKLSKLIRIEKMIINKIVIKF